MDAMVSGRIPVEVKKRGAAKLAEIGATQSQLIKSAYEYLLAEGKLPIPSRELKGPALLGQQEIEELEQFINNTTVCLDDDFWKDFDYKRELAEGKRADYEALA